MKFTQILLTLLPLVLAQRPDNDICQFNTDCSSEFCDTSMPQGTSPGSCGARPSANGTPCSKALEAEQCQTGYCEQWTNQCEYQKQGGACSDTSQCTPGNICGVQRSSGNQVCLVQFVGSGESCDVTEQCPGKETCVEGICSEPTTPTAPLGPGEECKQGSDCESGICADHIANDGNKLVCLAKDVGEGDSCDVNEQCTTGYCVPQGQANALTCQKEGSEPSTPTPPTPVTPNPPANQEQEVDEVVTTTVVRNGATETVIQTRIIGGAAGSARVSASRVSASASGSIRASTSVRASAAAGGAGRVADAASGWVGALALVLSAFVF